VDCIIKLYSNGFLVNNEKELRRYNKDSIGFLKDLKDGILPPELIEKCNEDVNIILEHHLEETFVYAPKPLVQPVTLENIPAPSTSSYSSSS